VRLGTEVALHRRKVHQHRKHSSTGGKKPPQTTQTPFLGVHHAFALYSLHRLSPTLTVHAEENEPRS
jgi:hypothetical protein